MRNLLWTPAVQSGRLPHHLRHFYPISVYPTSSFCQGLPMRRVTLLATLLAACATSGCFRNSPKLPDWKLSGEPFSAEVQRDSEWMKRYRTSENEVRGFGLTSRAQQIEDSLGVR